MTKNQKLEREVIEALEKTGLFRNIRLYGDLDLEGNKLTLEYKRAPHFQKRDFEIERMKIEEIMENDRGMNYPEVEIIFQNHPDEREVYTTLFTRIPLEGSAPDLTTKVLNYLLNGVRDNYLSRKGKK